MEFENLLILIKTVSDSELTDFAYEENGTSIHLKKKKEMVVVAGNQPDVPIAGLAAAQAAASPATVNAETVQAASSEPEGMIVKSPLVGTFYAAPSEDADPFVSVGDQVKKGDLLMEADLEQIKAADLNVITPVLIGNTADYSEIKMLKEGDVSAGDEILSLA